MIIQSKLTMLMTNLILDFFYLVPLKMGLQPPTQKYSQRAQNDFIK